MENIFSLSVGCKTQVAVLWMVTRELFFELLTTGLPCLTSRQKFAELFYSPIFVFHKVVLLHADLKATKLYP